MTIKVTATRNDNNSLHLIRIEVDESSIPLFKALVDRGLNCWDSAPKELKDLGDMLTHDRITQDHTYTPINTKQNTDYYSPEERVIIANYIEQRGIENWEQHIREGTAHKVLKGTSD
jgi:hypothetical protein